MKMTDMGKTVQITMTYSEAETVLCGMADLLGANLISEEGYAELGDLVVPTPRIKEVYQKLFDYLDQYTNE